MEINGRPSDDHTHHAAPDLAYALKEAQTESAQTATVAPPRKISAFRKVTSYSSTARYRNEPKPLPEIAKELNVTGIIEGSVLGEGQSVRISARLIHAPSERILWTESYDRRARDILALQREIPRTVVEQGRVALTPREEKRLAGGRPVNTGAYDAYLRGKVPFRQFSPVGFANARTLFEEAISKNPSLALAYYGMADDYGAQAYWGYQSPRDIDPQMRRFPAILRALGKGSEDGFWRLKVEWTRQLLCSRADWNGILHGLNFGG